MKSIFGSQPNSFRAFGNLGEQGETVAPPRFGDPHRIDADLIRNDDALQRAVAIETPLPIERNRQSSGHMPSSLVPISPRFQADASAAGRLVLS